MNYEIPANIIEWEDITNETFMELWNSRQKNDLKLSYLFHNDIPFSLACNPNSHERPEDLEKVFARNAELRIVPREGPFGRMYSMAGLQQQFNEVIRMQYYYPDSMPLACHLYYLEAYNDGDLIHREIKMMPLTLDVGYVKHWNLINHLVDKHADKPGSLGAILFVAGCPQRDNTRALLSSYLNMQIQQIHDKIKSITPKE